jgi:hypothetical protein
MSYELPPSIESLGPIGDGNYAVQDGDCIESLAYRTGHIWQTIWNHPKNSELRKSRLTRNVLLPGDQLYIPPIAEKTLDRPTEAKHKFVRKGTKSVLQVCILEAGQPRADEPFELVIDDTQTVTGTTDSAGWINVKIAPSAQQGKLRVGSNPLQAPYVLALGGMDPITEPAGIQKRLRNLGFPCQVSNTLDEQTRAALALFQKGEDLDSTGEPDRDTLNKLKNRAGC